MLFERFLKKVNLPFIIILLIPTILSIIWFRNGNIMGAAESGLPFYNFKIHFNLNKEAWSSYALGFPNNIGVASTPTYWFFATFQDIGIPSFLLQMFFFWLVLVISGIGIFLLAKELLPELENKFLIVAVFFYWFNPFSMLNIWNRFLNNFLLSYAFIPIALYLFIRGINLRRYSFAILIGLLSLVFSHAQTSITFDIIFWFILFYTSIFYIFINKDWTKRFFIFKFLILTFFFWVLVNIWWIGQVFSYLFQGSFNTVSSSTFTTLGNYQTFSSLSKSLGNLVDLIRLRHNYFPDNSDLSWIKIFDFPLLTLFNFFMAAIVLIPLIFKKNRQVFFAGGLFLIGIFLTKGNNPPFGEINDKLFFLSPVMQVFRNPFEKFGFLLAFSSTLLFTQGLYFINEILKQEHRKIFYLFIMLTITLIWGMPFWTGFVFVGFEEPINKPGVGYQVQVPQYYKEASKWLESQKEDFRILVFPLGGEGITYNWEKGYSGLELTNQLLPKSAVSFNTNIPFYDKVSNNIQELFLTTTFFPSIANALNTKYIMLRQDIDWELRKMKNPKVELSILEAKEQKGELKKIAQFGELSFWEIMSKKKDKIYLSSSTLLSYSKPEISDLDFSRSNLVTNSKDKISKIPDDKIEGEIIHPQAQFFLDHQTEPVFEIRQDIFPHVSISPTDKMYSLVVLKDRLKEGTINDVEKLLEYRVVTLGKRLVEVKLSADSNYENGIVLAINGYHNLLVRTFNLIEEFEKTDQRNNQAVLQSRLYLLFSRHIKVLEDIINKPDLSSSTRLEVESVLKELKTNLVRAYIYPAYGFLINDNFPIKRRSLYNFEVSTAGDYELLWDKKILDGFYKLSAGDQIILQIDDKFSTREIENEGQGYVSLGKIHFEKGSHELGLNLPDALNLVDAPQQINFKVDHGSKVSMFPVKNYDTYSSYSIDFDYWIKKGNGVLVSVYDKKPENITPNTKPSSTFVVGPDLYDYTEKNIFRGFKLSEKAEDATVSLTVFPWNDCETIFYSARRDRCKNEEFRRPYDKTTEIDISKLDVGREFTDLPMLIREDLISTNEVPRLEFQKLDSTTYIVNIENAKRPFFLVFSELFDQGWKVIDIDGKYLNYQHFLANGYANSWYIDREGSYKIILKFTPQYLLDYGKKISIVAIFIGIIFVLFNTIRRRNVQNY